MIGRLNHVGIAVPSIEDAKATYRDLYGVAASDITETRELPAQGVKFAFVNVANSQIELIEPLGADQPDRATSSRRTRRAASTMSASKSRTSTLRATRWWCAAPRC